MIPHVVSTTLQFFRHRNRAPCSKFLRPPGLIFHILSEFFASGEGGRCSLNFPSEKKPYGVTRGCHLRTVAYVRATIKWGRATLSEIGLKLGFVGFWRNWGGFPVAPGDSWLLGVRGKPYFSRIAVGFTRVPSIPPRGPWVHTKHTVPFYSVWNCSPLPRRRHYKLFFSTFCHICRNVRPKMRFLWEIDISLPPGRVPPRSARIHAFGVFYSESKIVKCFFFNKKQFACVDSWKFWNFDLVLTLSEHKTNKKFSFLE